MGLGRGESCGCGGQINRGGEREGEAAVWTRAMDRPPLDRLYDGCGAWTGSMEVTGQEPRDSNVRNLLPLFEGEIVGAS
jgi:hypothetical protein